MKGLLSAKAYALECRYIMILVRVVSMMNLNGGSLNTLTSLLSSLVWAELASSNFPLYSLPDR